MSTVFPGENGRVPTSSSSERTVPCPSRTPFLLNDWMRAVFIHFEVDPVVLQPLVPYPLDLRDGAAYVSVVAFEMERLRLWGSRIFEILCAPVGNHGFLNVRTYVRRRDEPGIYFLAEWLPHRLNVIFGPPFYGLPFSYGRLSYDHAGECGVITGSVEKPGVDGRLRWRASLDPAAKLHPCVPGSVDEFVIERYTAFTRRRGVDRLFRIWHPPWPQQAIDLELEDASLLRTTGPWVDASRRIGANWSPGLRDVHMSAPRRC